VITRPKVTTSHQRGATLTTAAAASAADPTPTAHRRRPVLAYDYPLLGLFWTLALWFLFFAWIMLVFRVIVDIFRSHDMGGFAKALWSIFVIVIPWLGVLVYIIARGKSMSERDYQQAQAQQEQFQAYVKDVAATSGGTADELAKLAELKAQGVLTDAEFEQQKAKVLA
jgi:uncharacterized membrane protein YhaH (DUF805 family)